jgi:hypothetical protein
VVDVPALVHAAAALEELDLGILRAIGLVDQASGSSPIKAREVPALEEPNEVRGSNDEGAVRPPMHALTLSERDLAQYSQA